MEWIQFWLLMILERRAPKSLGQTELEDHRQSKKNKKCLRFPKHRRALHWSIHPQNLTSVPFFSCFWVFAFRSACWGCAVDR